MAAASPGCSGLALVTTAGNEVEIASSVVALQVSGNKANPALSKEKLGDRLCCPQLCQSAKAGHAVNRLSVLLPSAPPHIEEQGNCYGRSKQSQDQVQMCMEKGADYADDLLAVFNGQERQH